jgi:hypothetical protein
LDEVSTQRFVGVGEAPRDDQMNAYRDIVVQWSKDLGRTIDYLETRPDIDTGKLGYYGISAGASHGAAHRRGRVAVQGCRAAVRRITRDSTPSGSRADQFRAAHHGADID